MISDPSNVTKLQNTRMQNTVKQILVSGAQQLNLGAQIQVNSQAYVVSPTIV